MSELLVTTATKGRGCDIKILSADDQTAAGSGDAVVNLNFLQHSSHHEPCVYSFVTLFTVADKMLIQVNISGMSRVVCQSEFGEVWELLHFTGKQNLCLKLLNCVFEMTHLSFPVYNPAGWVSALVSPQRKVTSLIRHSLPLPNPTTPPPTWTSVAMGSWGCCVCNVTAIFYSWGWSVWVALLETGTQSLLPVNTNLMGLTGWEELWHLGEDGMYKKWTTSMCQTRAKRSERENVAA